MYEMAPDFYAGEQGWLGFSKGKLLLFFFPLGKSEDTITVINPETLKVETSFELEGTGSMYKYTHTCRHIQ